MAKVRVTGRFYVFLMLVAAIVLFIFRDSIFTTSESAVVTTSVAKDVRQVKAVIVRDETLYSEKQVSRVEFIAPEHTLVRAGDPVAYVYSLEYSERLINELNNIRKNIQQYHKVVLGNELDSQLEVYDLTVKQKALDLKSLVRRTTNGNFLKLVEQLESSMEERRQYMSANMRSDTKLIKYYDEEKQKISTIDGWRTAKQTDRDGIVSFYLDGYEDVLTVDSMEDFTISKMQTVLAGGSLGDSSSRTNTDIFRVVNQNNWYMVVLSEDSSWNPVIGNTYTFQMQGFEDLVYTGVVSRVQKSGTTVMAQLAVTDPIGPLIYQRSGIAALGTDLSGFSVPAKAIVKRDGQDGVLLFDVPGGTFIPVEVIHQDGDRALIFPMVEGAIVVGSHVLIE
ncbi:MAG: hypothetical protein IJC48_02095 [Clostridia bacterium]|nr:hypothetical protein [Clostridia bacterium]